MQATGLSHKSQNLIDRTARDQKSSVKIVAPSFSFIRGWQQSVTSEIEKCPENVKYLLTCCKKFTTMTHHNAQNHHKKRVEPMEDRIGQQLGNYRLTSLLGRGGFADVYHG